MELHEQIISKNEVNSRAVQALLAIIANGLVATKSDLAECLGAKPAKFSEILNYRMKVGVDMIAKICDWYYVNPDWLLMGRGNNIFRKSCQLEPYFIEDDNNLDRKWHPEDNEETVTDQPNTQNAQLEAALKERTAMADMFYQKTLEQAELIGKLRAQISELEQRLGKSVGGVSTGGTANVG